MEIPLAVPGYTEIQLHRSAAVRGRVTQDGEPVRDFWVSYWPEQYAYLRVTETFTDRDDGSFVLRDAPRGSLGILAASAISPGSEPLQIELGETGADVELRLEPALAGTGRVVDQETLQPIHGARIQPLMVTGQGPGDPWGDPLPVADDGSFEISAFRDGGGMLAASAQGYGTRTASAVATDGRLDFGVLTLSPRVNVDVVVLGLAADPAQVLLRGRGPEPIALSAFVTDEDGTRRGRLEGISQGLYRLYLTLPDGSEQDTYLDVGPATNEIVFHGGGAGSVVVSLADDTEGGSSDSILLDYHTPEGLRIQRARHLLGAREARFDGIPAGPVGARLLNGAKTLALAEATAVDGGTVLLELSAGSAAIELEVRDSEGKPLSNVFVRLWQVLGDIERVFSGATDAHGRCSFAGLSSGKYVLDLVHATHGTLAGYEISVGSAEVREVALRLVGKAGLILLLRDGDAPLAGISCTVLNTLGKEVLPPKNSNAEGRIELAGLMPDTYRIHFAAPEIWSEERTLEAAPGAVLEEIELRRLGNLRLRTVEALSGAALPKVSLEVVFAPTGETLSSWIAAGRVSHAGPLASDASGELELSSLPHGRYSWNANGQSGEFDVVAGATAEAAIVLGGPK
jgi:hypothetical protein